MTGLFAAYLVERFRPAVFVPATALHLLLALWASGAEPTAARLLPAPPAWPPCSCCSSGSGTISKTATGTG